MCVCVCVCVCVYLCTHIQMSVPVCVRVCVSMENESRFFYEHFIYIGIYSTFYEAEMRQIIGLLLGKHMPKH